MRHGILVLMVALLPGLHAFAEGEATVEGVRANLEQWVKTRQLTSRLQADWRAEKEMLEQTAVLFEKELADLDDQLGKADTGTSEVGRERDGLEAEKKEIEILKAEVAATATRLEERVRVLAMAFPPPLAGKLDSLMKQLPEDPANTRISPEERMQQLVGILNEVDKFNSAISVESELQKRPSGEELQVKTLYVGLGQAYFVDSTGGFAGVGVPASDGWTWTEASDLGSRILKAIAIYENTQPPAFEGLPMTCN